VGAVVVVPADVADDGELKLAAAAPDALGDQFGLEAVDERLRERVVVGVADRADRGEQAMVGERLRVVGAGVLGGFNWSSQRLDGEELRWERFGDGDEQRIVQAGRGCGRRVGGRLRGGRAGSGSGRRSLAACRARMRPPRRACRRRSASGGSGRVAGCHRSARGRRRGVTCRSVSGGRSRCCARAARECGRSRGGFGVRRRRSRASCVAMRRPAAAGSSTAPRRRSGTPIGARVDRRRPSWPATRGVTAVRAGAARRDGDDAGRHERHRAAGALDRPPPRSPQGSPLGEVVEPGADCAPACVRLSR
jgi:hypothetical protein